MQTELTKMRKVNGEVLYEADCVHLIFYDDLKCPILVGPEKTLICDDCHDLIKNYLNEFPAGAPINLTLY